jgi:tetratricopeptide (TPR) repeat protein
MKFRPRWMVGLSFLLFAFIRCNAQSYHSELKLGVDAYKSSQYEQAIVHFRKATELDPSQPVAHLYLATAYVSQYIPGVESPDNVLLAEHAVEQYQRVLELNPAGDSKINSVKEIAYVYLNRKKFEDAKKYYRMASELDPNDPESYYSLGVIDWTECYQPRMEARTRLGMRPGENLTGNDPDQKKLCTDLRAKNTASIEDGIENLNEAIEHRPDYDDAMAYMNLMYREKADLECDDPAARRRDLKIADEWVNRTLATKKAKAEKNSAPTEPNPQ